MPLIIFKLLEADQATTAFSVDDAGNIVVAGALTYATQITSSGSVTMPSSLAVTTSETVGTTLAVGTNATVGGTLAVTGATTHTGALNAATFSATGPVTLSNASIKLTGALPTADPLVHGALWLNGQVVTMSVT